MPQCKLSKTGERFELFVEGRRSLSNLYVKQNRNGKFYVSFYYDSYRHWANHVVPEVEFNAKRTNDYYFYIGGSRRHNQQIHMDKVARNTRRRHRQPLG